MAANAPRTLKHVPDVRFARKRDRGFVLLATLWVLAALVVLAAYVSDVTDVEAERAIRAKENLQRELQRRSLENTLLYLLATGRMNHRGIVLEAQQRFADYLADDEVLPAGEGELLATGQPYETAAGLGFSIQDESGLASVNSPRSRLLAGALAYVGVSSPNIARITSRVVDYVDTDQRLSLNGAESYDYRQRDMAAPPDWPMASPLELRRVLGVQEMVSSDQWRRLRPLLTIRPALGYNINTMRPEVLTGLLTLDEAALRRVLEARAQGSVRWLRQIAMLTGRHMDIDPMALLSIPSRFLRMATWDADGRVRHIVGIELMPFGEDVPWSKNYRYQEPASDDDWTRFGDGPRQAATTLLQ